MILFLDFDGVLHPDAVYLQHGRPVLQTEGQLFQWAPLLIEELAPYPDVRIVLSTSWVRWLGFRKATLALPIALQSKVIGATWHSRIDPVEWEMLSRHGQIRRYIVGKSSPWLALDDDDAEWVDGDRQRLILCQGETGIGDPNVRDGLRGAFREIALGAPRPVDVLPSQRETVRLEAVAQYFKSAGIDSRLVRLSVFPILAVLAHERTEATQLDGRACRQLYQKALSRVPPNSIPPHELAWMRLLGVEPPGCEHVTVVVCIDETLAAITAGGDFSYHPSTDALADWLLAQGIHAENVRMPDWREGDIAPAAGDKMAMLGRMRQAEREV